MLPPMSAPVVPCSSCIKCSYWLVDVDSVVLASLLGGRFCLSEVVWAPGLLLLRCVLCGRGRAFYTPHERHEEADMTETGVHCDTSYCVRLKDEIEDWKSSALQGGLAKVRSVSPVVHLPCGTRPSVHPLLPCGFACVSVLLLVCLVKLSPGLAKE